MSGKIITGDCLEMLKTLPDESVDCCVTSPPYYGLRDYGTGKWIGGDPNCPHYRTSKVKPENTDTGHKTMFETGNAVGDAIYKSVCPLCGAVREDRQIGLEDTPEQYIEKLTEVFREVKRVLKDDGTLWVNIGDSYATGGGRYERIQSSNPGVGANNQLAQNSVPFVGTPNGCKGKDLIGIPWMLAFALRADGWYLRQDIIWHKPNPMPESVTDRCTKSHEYIFLLSKNPHYYFDYKAIQEQSKYGGTREQVKGVSHTMESERRVTIPNLAQQSFVSITDKRNKRDVWSVTVKAIREAHFATFPEDLIAPCILAGSRKGGTVLDPFFGSGTTGRVATKYGRDYIGIELNPEYVEISERRTNEVQLDILSLLGEKA